LQYSGSHVAAAINVVDVTTAPPVGSAMLDAGTFKPFSCAHLCAAGGALRSAAQADTPKHASKTAATEAEQNLDDFIRVRPGWLSSRG